MDYLSSAIVEKLSVVIKQSPSQLLGSYADLVRSHPDMVTQIESAARMLSYVLPGASEEVSEAIYSAVNLLSVLHDSLLRVPQPDGPPAAYIPVATAIMAIQAVEVVVELLANRTHGRRGRFYAIVAVESAKAILRLYLLLAPSCGHRILTTPALPTVSREHAARQLKDVQKADESAVQIDEPIWVGAHSRCVVRKIATYRRRQSEGPVQVPFPGAVALIDERIQTLLQSPTHETIRRLFLFNTKKASSDMTSLLSWTTAPEASRRVGMSLEGTALRRNRLCGRASRTSLWRLFAEALYALRPLLTIIAMVHSRSRRSWRPFLTALFVDVLSRLIHHQFSKFYTEQQRVELSRRNSDFAFYLVRDPVFTRHSRAWILSFLARFGSLPFCASLSTALSAYLPLWQKTHFYTWSL